jgi:hypothetical protein
MGYIHEIEVPRQKLLDCYQLMTTLIQSNPAIKLSSFGQCLRVNEQRLKAGLEEYFDLLNDEQAEYNYAKQEFAVKDANGVALTHPVRTPQGQGEEFNIPAEKQRDLDKKVKEIQKEYAEKMNNWLYNEEGEPHRVKLKVSQASHYPAFSPIVTQQGQVIASAEDLRSVFMGILLNSESTELKPMEILKP